MKALERARIQLREKEKKRTCEAISVEVNDGIAVRVGRCAWCAGEMRCLAEETRLDQREGGGKRRALAC